MKKNHLNILWTNADPITVEHMVMLYAKGAVTRNWFDKVTVIVWGNSSKLVAENETIQNLVINCQEAGVEFVGCLHCAQQLGAEEKLTELGVDLKYMGAPLTDLIKNDEHLITI